MVRALLPRLAAAALLAALAAGGCGSGGSDQSFTDCGNGRLDADEGCDDGNMADHDACPSACQPARCGDGVAFTGVEDCDGRDLDSGTCEPLGLTGEPVCDQACRYDYSACGPPPTLTLPPTATFTPAPPTPTPTPTPGSSCGDGLLSMDETCASCADDCTPQACGEGTDMFAVSVSLTLPASAQLSGVELRLAYRTSLVSLPSTGLSSRFVAAPTQPGLQARATDLDYAANVRVARSPGLLTSGPMFTVSFDRCAGAAVPTGSDFACTVTNCGTALGCTCTADVP